MRLKKKKKKKAYVLQVKGNHLPSLKHHQRGRNQFRCSRGTRRHWQEAFLPFQSTLLIHKSLSRVRPFTTPWTVTYQAPPSMRFSRQEYLEWVAISFSRGSSQPRDWSQVSCIAGRRFNLWATREALDCPSS